MHIGLDVDEVLARLMDGLLPHLNERYGTSYNLEDMNTFHLHERWKVSPESIKKSCFEYFAKPEFEEIQPLEYSVKGVRTLALSHHLSTLTSRPMDIHHKTVAWIERHYGKQIQGHHCTNQFGNGSKRSKSEMCLEHGIGLLIEDNVDYARECFEKGIRVILLNQPWNQYESIPKGVIRVKSWLEIPGEVKLLT